MSITAAQKGRNLHITLEGIEEPFIIAPLPGFAGEYATELFLKGAAKELPGSVLSDVWQLCLDGVQGVTEDGDPIPVFDGPNWTRVRQTLSMHEGENVVHLSFYWQTTLGIDGVNEFIEVGGGLAGAGKVLTRLLLTLGISPMQTSHSSALENLTQRLDGSLPTSTPKGGEKPEQPQPKGLSFLNRKARREASRRSNSGA